VHLYLFSRFKCSECIYIYIYIYIGTNCIVDRNLNYIPNMPTGYEEYINCKYTIIIRYIAHTTHGTCLIMKIMWFLYKSCQPNSQNSTHTQKETLSNFIIIQFNACNCRHTFYFHMQTPFLSHVLSHLINNNNSIIDKPLYCILGIKSHER